MGAEWRPVNRPNATAFSTNVSYATTEYPPLVTTSAAASASPTTRWYEPTIAAAPRASKIFGSNEDVRVFIAEQLGMKLAADFRLFLGDHKYYFPPVADAAEIIKNSGLARAEYMPETFDCDDFAIVLKSHFCEAAYRDFQRRPPHCFGLIWGELPHVHAINWMVNDDGRIRFVEPQTGEIFEPRPEHRNITFMMA